MGGRRLPVHGLADGLPDAVHQRRRAARRDRAGAGRRRRRGHRAGRSSARPAGYRMWVTSRDEAKRARAVELGADRGLRVRRAAARAGRRRHGDRRRGHLDALVKSLKPGRHARHLRRHSRRRAAEGRADRVFFRQLRVIGSTMGTRLELERLAQFVVQQGSSRSSTPCCRWSRPARGSPRWRQATCSARSSSPSPESGSPGLLPLSGRRAARGYRWAR